MPDHEAIEAAVRAHYAAAARRVLDGSETGTGCATEPGIGASCYGPTELEEVPAAAVAASIGCANPVAVAELSPGEVVLDLGSGGGIDVLLSARRVGPTGKAYGLDMTDEMLELARANLAKAGVDNVEFLRGHMEAIPLPSESVDVVLSNCVIALSTDKGAVFAEAHRVLQAHGRLALADVVADADRAPRETAAATTWIDCMTGALTQTQYRASLERAGFVNVSIQASHAVGDGYTSVIVRASKSTP